jgi:hypothetical protein
LGDHFSTFAFAAAFYCSAVAIWACVEHSVAESGKLAESRLLDGFRVDADAVFAAGKHR